MATRQDKATTERNARTLREMLKRPENKLCADCNRNGEQSPLLDSSQFHGFSRPAVGVVEYVRALHTISRGAKMTCLNSGCFMCIRCSGIHRSMGTHISKVKSVDLDTWTPEQMAVRLYATFVYLRLMIVIEYPKVG